MHRAAQPEYATVRIGWVLTAWLGFAAVDASRCVLGMQAAGMQHDWLNLFLLYFLGWLPWPLATPAILRSGQRPWFGSGSLRNGCVLVVGLLSMFVVSSVWFAALDSWLEPWLDPGPPAPFRVKLRYAQYSWILPVIILYAFVFALGMWLRSRQTLAAQQIAAARINEQLAVAELSVLRNQIEPHFLFNTLNGVVGLLREQKIDPAVSAIVDLSELLRATLQRSNQVFVALHEEVELLARYLDIQRTRFEDRLRVDIDVPSALYPLPVPALLLQPLVENAIKHGIEQLESGGCVRIRAERHNDSLQIRVYNDGPALGRTRASVRSGIGIANLRKRLEIQFGARAMLELKDCEGGVEVLVQLPIAADPV